MIEPMNKALFLDKTRSTRAELDALLAQLDDEQMIQERTCGDWSVKDVLAHITWHEKEMIQVLAARALDGSELWDLPLDPRNQAIYAENKDRELREVREEAQQVFPVLMEKLEAMAEEDLHDPGRFPGMPEDWKPWEMIASNTYEHYEDHIPELKALVNK